MKKESINKKALMYRKIANAITIMRCFIVIPIIYFLSQENLLISWLLIIFSGISDILDGWFARLSRKKSIFGAKLDPLADKLVILAPILWLTQKGILPIWAVWILITRELLISSWRSNQKEGAPASNIGKMKTILQFISILFLIWPINIFGQLLAAEIQLIGIFMFWMSLAMSIYSAIKYLI